MRDVNLVILLHNHVNFFFSIFILNRHLVNGPHMKLGPHNETGHTSSTIVRGGDVGEWNK